jgi:hypothetical protein
VPNKSGADPTTKSRLWSATARLDWLQWTRRISAPSWHNGRHSSGMDKRKSSRTTEDKDMGKE